MGRGGEVAGFWQSPALAGTDVPADRQRSLGEGGTPLAASIADPRVLLKREDLNPSGSHKDRAACFQVARAAAAGDPAVTISSSGNAAIATSRYAALHGIAAYVCVHPATDPAKLHAIDGSSTTIIVTPRAINTAKHIARELRIQNLRPSVHDDALTGYATLGAELEEAPVDAVVLFATSGATAVAVAEWLAERRPGVEVHFVQGEGNAALADPSSVVDTASARAASAGRLGVRRSRRGRQLLRAIEATGGRGWVATEDMVCTAHRQLVAEGIDVSDESAANFAVAQQIAAAGDRRVACVISGAPPRPSGSAERVVHADDEHEALATLRELAAHGLR